MIVINNIRPQIPPKTGSFNLNLRLGGVPANYRGTEYETWLYDMKTFFERIVISNRTLNMDVQFRSLSGSILAQCGPGPDGDWTQFMQYLNDVDMYTDKTARPNRSTMVFNTNYYKQPPVTETDRSWKRQFFTTALHECFHGLGLGSLWNGNFRVLAHIPNPIPDWLPGGGGGINVPLAVATNFGFPFGFEYNMIGYGDPDNPRYDATYGRADYRSTMGTLTGGVWSNTQSGASNIPIENFDGTRILPWNTTMVNAGGTALAHWRGSYHGTLSGIVNNRGHDHVNEVFTSWSSRGEGVNRWIGRYTLGALRDIGWYVDYAPLAIALHDWKTA